MKRMRTWKKTGGGSFRLPNRIIKPNQVFKAYEEEIPESFRDVVIPLDDVVEQVSEKEDASTPQVTDFKVVHRAGKWYDIESASGKKLNEKALSKEDAEKFIADLSSGKVKTE